MKQFVYIDPKTFQPSVKKYSGTTPIKAVRKIYEDIITEYSNYNTIMSPTLVVYLRDVLNPKKIYGFEANIASFNMKSHIIKLQHNGKTEIVDITKSLPRIIETPISTNVKKQIKSKIPNTKKDFFQNYLVNQTYDISHIFQNISTNKYIITINDYSVETTTQLFQIVDNHLFFIDILATYVSTDWLKSGNFQIRFDQSEKILSVQITYSASKQSDTTQTEINIYNTNKEQQSAIYEMLINTYGKKNII